MISNPLHCRRRRRPFNRLLTGFDHQIRQDLAPYHHLPPLTSLCCRKSVTYCPIDF
ncbi:hypothetical protein Patl1_28683 [Pistacia atlantica]|uniref:Uncharacterized protein n=1 Tax=Pistacia atlantica TaxID=434234 RepID=A0ACC1BFG2_9ROSI|nr:hypothetical protein Patl1_28683 [Pistacia atlantica]